MLERGASLRPAAKLAERCSALQPGCEKYAAFFCQKKVARRRL